MKKYVVEFIGTFFFLLTIGTVVVGLGNDGIAANDAFAPIAIGSALMVMIFAGGHISGAHYNPAVTLGVYLRGKIDMGDIPGYIIAQILGGALAAIIVGFLSAGLIPDGKDIIPLGISTVPAFLAEFLGTFALVYVVLNVATAKGTSGNSFYGLAIGFTVTVMAYALGGFSGGAFNPAVAIGAAIMNLVSFSDIWLHILAELLAAAAAAYTFLFVNGKE